MRSKIQITKNKILLQHSWIVFWKWNCGWRYIKKHEKLYTLNQYIDIMYVWWRMKNYTLDTSTHEEAWKKYTLNKSVDMMYVAVRLCYIRPTPLYINAKEGGTYRYRYLKSEGSRGTLPLSLGTMQIMAIFSEFMYTWGRTTNLSLLSSELDEMRKNKKSKNKIVIALIVRQNQSS